MANQMVVNVPEGHEVHVVPHGTVSVHPGMIHDAAALGAKAAMDQAMPPANVAAVEPKKGKTAKPKKQSKSQKIAADEAELRGEAGAQEQSQQDA